MFYNCLSSAYERIEVKCHKNSSHNRDIFRFLLAGPFVSNLHPKVLQNCIMEQIMVMVCTCGKNVLAKIEVMVSFLEVVLGGIRVILLIGATVCPFEPLE